MTQSRSAARARAGARVLTIAFSLLLLNGCTQGEKGDDHAVRIIPGNPGVAVARASVARPTHGAAPTAAAAHARVAILDKTFADPTLPPELRDDGGLAPLPPRPVVSAMTTMHPAFEGAAPSATGEEAP